MTAGIIVGSVSAGLLIITGLFLLTAHCLKTRALERRVKAYDTSAADNKTEANNQDGQPRQNLGVPGVMDIPGSVQQLTCNTNVHLSISLLQAAMNLLDLEPILSGRLPWTMSLMRMIYSS